MELTITEKERKVLSVALKMSKGDFPWAYRGAPRPEDRDACAYLLQRIESISISMSFKCGCRRPATMDDAIAGEIEISPEEALVLIRSLNLYTGKCPDYAGASLWESEANKLAGWITRCYSIF